MSEKDLPPAPAMAIDHDSVYGGLQRDLRTSSGLDTYKMAYTRDSSIVKPPLSPEGGDEQHPAYPYPYPPPESNYPEMAMRAQRSHAHLTGRAEMDQEREYGELPDSASDSTAAPRSHIAFNTSPNTIFSLAPEKVEQISANASTAKRRCRRRIFIAATLILPIIIGLVLGLVFGLRMLRRSSAQSSASSPSSSSTPPSPAPAPNARLGPHDPIAGGSFTALASVPPDPDLKPQKMQLIFQEANNTIIAVDYSAPVPGWTAGRAILTDAKNQTGLAAFSYLNGTTQCSFLLYIDPSNQLQGKALIPGSTFWEFQFPLSTPKFMANTSETTADDNGGSRLAAVWSADFANGPGARAFYHTGTIGSKAPSQTQELIWDQGLDTWTPGQVLDDVLPTSHLAAIMDEDILRVFYCVGKGSIQESRLNVTDANANYTKGISKKNILHRDDAPFAIATYGDGVYIYHAGADGIIREQRIGGAGGLATAFPDDSKPLTITAAGKQGTIPVAVAVSQNPVPAVNVFYPDFSAKNERAKGVIDSVFHSTRNLSEAAWPSNPSDDTSNKLTLWDGTV